MISEEETKKRLQILRLAHMILAEESTNRFNQEYKDWVSANDLSWRTTGIKLEAPTPPPDPTEAEIVTRALEYYKSAAESLSTVKTNLESTDEIKENNTTPAVRQDSILDPVRKIFEAPASIDLLPAQHNKEQYD